MAAAAVRRGAKVGLGLGAATVSMGCWYYRPVRDDSGGGGPTAATGPDRRQSGGPVISAQSLSDDALSVPWVVQVGRAVITPVVISLSRLFLMGLGRFEIRQDANYEQFLKAAMTRPRQGPRAQALITVSNHRSMFDDPPILSCLLPWSYAVQPKHLRVNMCSQEFCFSDSFPSVIHAFFGTGKSLPIWRGGGINQKLLLDYSRHVAAGEWCHLFPEGGVWQDETLGGRGGQSGNRLPISQPCNRLKWGIGKVIAHAPVTPTVIPFFHSGMETVIPMDPVTRKTRQQAVLGMTVPIFNIHGGHNVRVVFGPALDFSDLIEAHEKEHGPLTKVFPSEAQQLQDLAKRGIIGPDEVEGNVSFHKYWDSSKAERELYSKITLRIEEALLALNKEARRT